MIKPLQSFRRSSILLHRLKLVCLLLFFFGADGTDVLAQTWPILGNETQIAAGTASSVSATTVEIASGDGSVTVPYIGFIEASKAKVRRFKNNTWESLGSDVSDGNASHAYLFSDANGKLYMSYLDLAASGKLAVKTFNPLTGTWEPLGGQSGNLHLSSGSVSWTGASQLNASHPHWMTFDATNRPYVVYSEASQAHQPMVKRFNGASWEPLGTGVISADKAAGLGIAIDQGDNTVFVVGINVPGTNTSGTIKVYSFKGTSWTDVVIPTASLNSSATTGAVTSARNTSIVLDGRGNLFIGYANAANSLKSTVITYSRSTTT